MTRDLVVNHWDTDPATGDVYETAVWRTPYLVLEPAPVPPPYLGVNLHALWNAYEWTSVGSPGGQQSAKLARHLDLLRDHRVSHVRIDYGVSTALTAKAPLSPTQYHNDRLLKALKLCKERGVQALICVHQSPEWMRPGTGTNVKQFPTDLNAWATFWREFASMLATAGYTDTVVGAEIWNEPNLSSFTGITDKKVAAQRYAAILSVAVKELDPTWLVSVYGGPSQCDDTFIKDVRASALMLPDVDAVHPYQGDARVAPEDEVRAAYPDRVTHYPAVQDAFVTNGDNAEVLWTEFGFSVHDNTGISPTTPWLFGVTEAVAADFLVRQIEMARVRWPEVVGVYPYAAWDPTGTQHARGYSLIVDSAGTTTPAPSGRLLALRDYYSGGH